jgi:Ca-activated chloride channel homolog
MNSPAHTTARWLLVGMLMLFTGMSAGAETDKADKTLSPYFMVKSDDPDVDRLPLKSTGAEVNIAGVIADVVVTQVYQNEGKRPLEAIYVFPASTRAAVYGMKMTIGERTIVAEIREREKARKEYEAAKQAGKSASLLEQQRPNVFQMNVANILPGDVIRVELRYTELLIPTDGTYQFVYPTVVGPRYSSLPEETAPASEDWVQNPYLPEGKAPTYTFDFTAAISAGMDIEKVTCPSHRTDIRFDGPAEATVRLADEESAGGNRDVILQYRLAGGNIESGLLLYEGEKENFFLLMMQPPERVESARIPPREYIFIVDVSGSMRGFPLDTAKTLLTDLIGHLRPTDRFNVLLFAGASQLMAENSLPATSENVNRATRFIDQQRGGGGTELLPALQRALDLSTETEISRSMVVVTDGYVRVETEAFDLIRNHLGEANLFAFGIGSSVNRFLIEGMARVGMGEPFVVAKPAEAPQKAQKFRRYIGAPVLTGIGLDFDGFDTYAVEPPSIPDLLAERPLTAFGKWRGKPSGTIHLTGITGGGKRHSEKLPVNRYRPKPSHSGLRYLWARHRIALLSDYNQVAGGDARAEEITQLGLEYNLLTAFTSFVAIDNRVRADGEPATVKQPLPLPQGVPETAVGGMAPRMARSLKASPQMNFAAPMAEADSMASSLVSRPAKKKPALPKIEIKHLSDKMVVNGPPSAQALAQIVEDHLPELEACVHQTVARHPGFTGGEGKIKVLIGLNGRATTITLLGITDTLLEQCFADRIRGWRLPEAADGKPYTVTFVLAVTVRS